MPNDQRVHPQSDDGQGSVEAKEKSKSTLSTNEKSGLNVALVHDWLNGMRGGEIVFEAMLDLYPNADVFTLLYEPKALSKSLREKLSKTRVHVSFLNRFQFTRQRYRKLLPLLPFAIRSFDLYPYDLILSSSHCVAKGVKKHPKAYHLSYIHAPMRYMWDRFEDYFGKGRIHPLYRMAAILLRPWMRAWDRATASTRHIDVMVANSQFIAKQIQRFYDREAKVIYPFANLERFKKERRPGSFYLMVGAFAPYKRTDLAIRAFARLGLPLKIVGQGQDHVALSEEKERVHAQTVQFLGASVSNEEIETLYAECKAFVFPGKEDFGITPLEAMASGAPVIAYGEGGACETVTNETGILFQPQTEDALMEAVLDIETGKRKFQAEAGRARAHFFTKERFQKEILSLIPSKFQESSTQAP